MASFLDCDSFDEEFKKLKRKYFRAALKSHPDKPGGDAEKFRKVRSAFETLRSIFDKKVGAEGDSSIQCMCFAALLTTTCTHFLSAHQTVDSYGDILKHAAARYADGSGTSAEGDGEGDTFKSWEFYAAAAEEPVPTYRVEKAKSGRSRCRAKGGAKKCGAPGFVAAGIAVEADDDEKKKEKEGKGKGKGKGKGNGKGKGGGREAYKASSNPAEPSYIAKEAIRVGVMDINGNGAGYGMWVHLACWRVPSTIWLGLPDPDSCSDAASFTRALKRMSEVTISGFTQLPETDQAFVVDHVMNSELDDPGSYFGPTVSVTVKLL